MTSNFTLATFYQCFPKGRFFRVQSSRSFLIHRYWQITEVAKVKKSGPKEHGIHFPFLYLLPTPHLPRMAPLTQLILLHRGSTYSLSLTSTQQLFSPTHENERESKKFFLSCNVNCRSMTRYVSWLEYLQYFQFCLLDQTFHFDFEIGLEADEVTKQF